MQKARQIAENVNDECSIYELKDLIEILIEYYVIRRKHEHLSSNGWWIYDDNRNKTKSIYSYLVDCLGYPEMKFLIEHLSYCYVFNAVDDQEDCLLNGQETVRYLWQILKEYQDQLENAAKYEKRRIKRKIGALLNGIKAIDTKELMLLDNAIKKGVLDDIQQQNKESKT